MVHAVLAKELQHKVPVVCCGALQGDGLKEVQGGPFQVGQQELAKVAKVHGQCGPGAAHLQ
eukprot:12524078-Prorocentrum_lima.AAC.1